MALSVRKCDHLKSFERKEPTDHACEECLETGSTWVHLRTCQTCGITLCCDSSPNRHARAHFNESSHPVIISAEPGETWAYCYADDAFAQG